MIDNRTSGQAVKGVGTILNELKADGKIEDYDTPENADITSIKFDVSSITLGVGDNEELTATFESGSDVGGYYAQIKGKKYLVSKVNDKIEIGKTEITTSGNSKREIASVQTSNSAVATAQIIENEKDKIKITGESGGTEGIATTTIIVKYTDSITTTITVNVKSKYTVNFYANKTKATQTTPEVLNAITIKHGENAFESEGYVAPKDGNLILDVWKFVATDSTFGIIKDAEATLLLEEVTHDLNVYGTYTEPPEFGEADIFWKYYFGDIVSTKSISDSEVVIGTANEGWQLFYVDAQNIYLIYSGFYPNSEMEFPTGVGVTKGGGNYGIAGDRRKDFLDYLKNSNNWSRISSAFNEKFNVSGVLVRGSPTVELFVASWNNNMNVKMNYNDDGGQFKGFKRICASKKETADWDGLFGRYICVEGDEDTTQTSIQTENLNPSCFPGKGNSNMYFPYTGDYETSGRCSWRLASPGAMSTYTILSVDYTGMISTGGNPSYNMNTVRPIVIIPRSKVDLFLDSSDDSISLRKVVQ